MNPIDLKDKFRGCIVGSAIGDALGYAVEFSPMETIRKRFGVDGIRELQPDRISSRETAAPYSDDTQMARAVAEGLIRAGRNASIDESAEEVAAEFIAWYDEPVDGHRAPGGACMSGCSALRGGVYWRNAGGRTAGGCGSVMRSHPYGLFFFQNPELAGHVAAEHSRMTHQAPIALAASAAMAVGTALALRGADPLRIAAHMISTASRYDEGTSTMLKHATSAAITRRPSSDVVFNRFRGWAAHEAVAAGLYAFLRYPDDFEECVVLAANTPGDSDSIACIAGALVGARVGFQKLPQRYVDGVEKSEQLQNLADRLRCASTDAQKLYFVEGERDACREE